MKTKKQKATRKQKARKLHESPITDTTRVEIGQNISFALDLMNDPRFKEDNFRQIEERNPRSYSLDAANDEMTIHFTIDWKGGSR